MFVLSRSWLPHVVIVLAMLASLSNAYKYFNEPRGRGLHHYDVRYFRGRVSAEKRAETLSELIVAFLDIMESEGIVTWLAHGTLMGWFWNGHALPWYLRALFYYI
jgi:LicD family